MNKKQLIENNIILRDDNTIFFFRTTEEYGFLSQWATCAFFESGKRFNSAEQYMMYRKAILFNDDYIAQRILNERLPWKQKFLGRSIMTFDEETWNTEKYNIVYRGNLLKFTQNDDLKEKLLVTGDKILVELSPYDAIWGVKLARSDSRKYNPSEWVGENLLGTILMDVRETLRHFPKVKV